MRVTVIKCITTHTQWARGMNRYDAYLALQSCAPLLSITMVTMMQVTVAAKSTPLSHKGARACALPHTQTDIRRRWRSTVEYRVPSAISGRRQGCWAVVISAFTSRLHHHFISFQPLSYLCSHVDQQFSLSDLFSVKIWKVKSNMDRNDLWHYYQKPIHILSVAASALHVALISSGSSVGSSLVD